MEAAPTVSRATSQTAPAPVPTPAWMLHMLVFVVGMASLGAEIAAARLLAPWFGASTIVWANTIATVLVALSIGYALGGRLADRFPSIAGLARLVLLAAALLALVPFVSGPFLRSSVQAFDQLSAGLFLGSLLSVGLLIAVPVLLLGMVSPYAVRLAVQHLDATGRTAGRLYAISTVGSLAGTFLAALLLIPVLGTRRTFLAFALVMALACLPALTGHRVGQLVAVAVVLAIGALMLVPVGTTKPETGSGRVIWEKETEYQYARVIQDPEGERRLELNEGQAVHSVYQRGRYLTGGYWDQLLVLPWAAATTPKRVAILGSAAGTTARALTHYYPGTRVDAVEIDPEVTAVGRELFDLHGAGIHTHTADARPWLQAQPTTSADRFDAILVDAYRQPYIPFYLTTREFFETVRDHLAPGGVVAINVGHPAGSDHLEKALSATLAAALGGPAHVARDVVDETNTMVLGLRDLPVGDGAGTADRIAADRLRALPGPADVQTVAGEAADRLAPALSGGSVYTDDRAPVEWLVDASLAQVAEH